MGDLLRFARGVDKSFRFNIELIGNTVFFIRKENSPTETIPDIRGFGHTFPEAYTTWEADTKGSLTHQRMIQYDFGGLKCLLRFESNGYINNAPTLKATDTNPSIDKTDDNDLLEALQATSVSQAVPTTTDCLRVEKGGAEVPQSSLFDLKTRFGRYGKNIDIEEFLPLFYLKQIPNFIVAYHNPYGHFDPRVIKVQNLASRLKAWEAENEAGLARFSVLLRKIIDLVKESENQLLEVYCPSVDRLEVRRQHGECAHALPAYLRDEWARENQREDLQYGPDSDDDTGNGVALEANVALDSDSDDGFQDFTA